MACDTHLRSALARIHGAGHLQVRGPQTGGGFYQGREGGAGSSEGTNSRFMSLTRRLRGPGQKP